MRKTENNFKVLISRSWKCITLTGNLLIRKCTWLGSNLLIFNFSFLGLLNVNTLNRTNLKYPLALCCCFFKRAHLHLLIILLLYSIPEAVWLIIDPGKPQRGQRQLKLECSLCRITMHFPFLRRSKAFFCCGFQRPFSYMGTWVSAKESQLSFSKAFLVLIFHSQPVSYEYVCMFVWVFPFCINR